MVPNTHREEPVTTAVQSANGAQSITGPKLPIAKTPNVNRAPSHRVYLPCLPICSNETDPLLLNRCCNDNIQKIFKSSINFDLGEKILKTTCRSRADVHHAFLQPFTYRKQFGRQKNKEVKAGIEPVSIRRGEFLMIEKRSEDILEQIKLPGLRIQKSEPFP